ncbi:V-type proton ATPase subunit E [Methanobacterium alcaliphilum]|uniref:V-type proton ATPase subunit E n=1 Tax=Methanobacterium alcaliphilum TaxID=392018 RepID=UPI00200B12EE|nr:V-type proton ATPase subunit E [Methanobacterium alcaliphilum]MCK9150985.1 V-type proton ATPase subunit E [Methanobacterium alcaliphilum]
MSSGADKIVSSILSDAQREADEIIQKAESEAASILDDGQQKALVEKEKILEDAKKQSSMKYQQIISESKMNARRAQLEAREELIEEAFKEAMEELKKIADTSSDEYKQSLAEIIKEAAVEIGGGDLTVHIKSEDVDKIKDSLGKIQSDVESSTGASTTLEIGENVETIGGAVLKTKNGQIEVNNTIEARMLRFKKNLRSEVAKVLFN